MPQGLASDVVDFPACSWLPSGNLTSPWKMAIEIVDFPIKHVDFPQLCQLLPEGSMLSYQGDFMGFRGTSPKKC